MTWVGSGGAPICPASSPISVHLQQLHARVPSWHPVGDIAARQADASTSSSSNAPKRIIDLDAVQAQAALVKGEAMTRDEATQAIAEGLEAMHAAYWAVCDAEEQAIDPAVLLAPAGVLDDAFVIVLSVEAFAQINGISWAEARGRF